MKNKIFMPLFLFCLLIMTSSLSSQEFDITGDWELMIQSQRGEMKWDVNFLQDGEELTVTMIGPRGNQVTGKGTLKGNQVDWSITRETPRGEMTITFWGTVDDGKITGEAQFGSRGNAEFTAHKKQ